VEVKYINDVLSDEMRLWYKYNPEDYIYEISLDPKSELDGVEYSLTHQQKELVQAVADYDMVTVRSGKGIGKTMTVANIAQWFLSCFKNPKIFISAPSSATINSALMPEIKRWISGSLVQPLYTTISRKIYYPYDDTGHTFIEARTAQKDNPDAMSGMHAHNMLIIVDEASGVSDEILTRLIDTCTGPNNKIVFISQMTRNSGIFWDSHYRDLANQWKKLHFSSVDSPLVPKKKIQAQIDNWGKDSDIVRVSVYGEPPKEDPDSFLPYSKVVSMFGRAINNIGSEEVEIGVDVARQGDDRTVWFWRQGFKVYDPLFKGKTTIPEVVDGTIDLVKKIRKETLYNGVIKIKIDDVGLGGGASDYLKLDTENKIEVVPCVSNGKGDESFYNEASMMWGQVRDQIDMIGLPGDGESKHPQAMRMLREELAARRVDYKTGRVRLESKDKFKKDYKRSPDFADAFTMMFFQKRGVLNAIKNFNPTNTFNVIKRPEYRNSYDRYAGLFHSNTGLTSFVVAHWGNGEMVVVDEFEGQINTMEMASIIVNSSPTGYRKIIANKNCFGGSNNSASAKNTIKRQLKKHGVQIKQDKSFDLFGSVQLLNQLVDDGNFKVLSKNKNMLEKLFDWRLDQTSVQTGDQFGLCMALVHVVSYLRKEIEIPSLSSPVTTPYSGDSGEESINTLREIHERSFV